MKTLVAMFLVLSSVVVPSVGYAQTATPVAVQTYNYVPGGPNYAWPGTGSDKGWEVLDDGWTRIRQAANGDFCPWTWLVRIGTDNFTALDQFAQWDSCVSLILGGPVTATVEIQRDLVSSSKIDPDPYVVANAKKSPLGLGWFVKGNGATVSLGGNSVAMNGLGVYQVPFPQDFGGVLSFEIQIAANGQVVMNQGELFTTSNTWEVPTP